MKTQLENIYSSAKADIEKAQNIAEIDEIRLKYLSRKGEFNSIKKGLKDLSPESIAQFIELKHFETLYTGNILRRTKNDVTSMDVAMPEVLQPNVEIYKKEVKKALA